VAIETTYTAARNQLKALERAQSDSLPPLCLGVLEAQLEA
jgi:hypothetical protein